MDRRISPPRDFEQLLDRLTEPASPGAAPIFQSKQKALMFAAALGHSLGVRTPLDKKGIAIRLDVFEKALDDGYVGSLAAAEAKSLQLLGADKEDERATIFEEYANRGLAEIQRRCFDASGDPLQILIQITEERGRIGDATVPGVDPSVLKDLVG
jgi:dnd system-associated protein 4